MAMGISGHKSLTSNTVGTFSLRAVSIAGSATVKGVLVAKTTSPYNKAALFLLQKQKNKKL